MDSEAALRSIFDACDDDDDGHISLAQLRSALETTELTDVDAILATISNDHVSFEEFHEAVLRLEQHLGAARANGDDLDIDLDDLSGEENVDEDEDTEVGVVAVSTAGDLRENRELSVTSTVSRDEGFVSSSHQESSPLDERLTAQFEAFGSTPSKTANLMVYKSSRSNQSSRYTSKEDIMDGSRVDGEEMAKMNEQVDELSIQLETALKERRRSVDFQSRLRQENKQLVERIYHLEEQIRDFESIKEEAVEQERKKRHGELVRLEEKKNAEVDTLTQRIQAQEAEMRRMEKLEREYQSHASEMRKEAQRLRGELQEARVCEDEVGRCKSEIDKMTRERNESLSREESLRAEIRQLEAVQMQTVIDGRPRAQSVDEREDKMRTEIRALKTHINDLEESNNELRAQFIQQGQAIIEEGIGDSLAAEMETASKDEIMARVKEVSEAYTRLRLYSEGLLLTVITKSPELLEKR
eukprot:m.4387 g.4387  ORF g.4387 m.4387 type:complete len:470 (+) comp10636_c0_seq1:45-1454(+)